MRLREYTVRKGETFGSLAFKEFGNSLDYRRIREINPQVDTLELHEGDVIFLPELSTDANSFGQLRHPEISMDSRGGGSLQAGRGGSSLDIRPWTNYANYLKRLGEQP